ncbi:PRD domain-containing protein [Microbacterium paulum]
MLDHLQLVLERLEKGVRIPATSMPELRVLYPAEYAAATEMTASIAASLDIELPPEESVFQVTTSIDDDGIWNAFARNGLI